MSKEAINKMFDLSGSEALVFGGTGKIGWAAVETLLEAGAKVVLTGRNLKKLKALEKGLEKKAKARYAKKIITYHLDPLNLEQLERCFKENPRCNILLNSLGYNDPKSILLVDETNYDKIMDANIKNAFFQTQFFYNNVKKNWNKKKDYSVIHISSQMGHVGGFERSVYCASKHALEGLVKAASIELGEKNVRINSIAPTFIKTPLTASTYNDPEKLKKISAYISLNRLGKVEDVATAVLYLASKASSLVTGTSLKVDGGWTAH